MHVNICSSSVALATPLRKISLFKCAISTSLKLKIGKYTFSLIFMYFSEIYGSVTKRGWQDEKSKNNLKTCFKSIHQVF